MNTKISRRKERELSITIFAIIPLLLSFCLAYIENKKFYTLVIIITTGISINLISLMFDYQFVKTDRIITKQVANEMNEILINLNDAEHSLKLYKQEISIVKLTGWIIGSYPNVSTEQATEISKKTLMLCSELFACEKYLYLSEVFTNSEELAIFIISIIGPESIFDTSAISKAGAIGLMQIIQANIDYLNEHRYSDLYDYNTTSLKGIDHNISAGIIMLNHFIELQVKRNAKFLLLSQKEQFEKILITYSGKYDWGYQTAILRSYNVLITLL